MPTLYGLDAFVAYTISSKPYTTFFKDVKIV